MQRFICFCILQLICSNLLFSEPKCHFKHYSTEDGLPQFTIMDMLQDKHGFMWFGTWDGLSKFDGYSFKNYKVSAGDNYFMKSNRIEKIDQDKYGRIWFMTYDGEKHCFDPVTLKFWGAQSIQGESLVSFKSHHYEIKPSGRVWLLSNDDGCILVKDSLFDTELYNVKQGKIKGETVYSVYEDTKVNLSWILTNNGITMVNHNNGKLNSFFYESLAKNSQKRQAFYSAARVKQLLMFGSQNGRVWQYDTQNETFRLLQAPTSSSITKIIIASNKEVIFVTKDSGFILYNLENQRFESFNKKTSSAMATNDQISESFLIHGKDFWFSTQNIGIYRFDILKRQICYYKTETDDPVRIVFPPRTMVFEDVKGRLWIQPKGGGFSLFDNQKNELTPFYNANNSKNWHFSNIIHSAISDRQGNLWMCTRSHGLEKVVFDQNNFQTEAVNSSTNLVTSNDVRAVFEDRSQNLWIATKDCRLTLYDKNKKRVGQLSTSGKILPQAYLPSMVYSLTQDNENNIWIGTKGGGLYKLVEKSPYNYSVEWYRNDINDVYSISDNSIYSIFQDRDKNIWIGTYGGGLNLLKKQPNGKTIFISYRNHLRNYPSDIALRVRTICQTAKGLICVGTTSGLLMFSPKASSPEKLQFNLYSRKPGDRNSLTNNDIHDIYITPSNVMHLATFGGGINSVSEWDSNGYPIQFKAFTSANGLPSDVTLSVLGDEKGYLWVSNENNLSKIDLKNNVVETFAEIKRLMQTNNFSEASTAILKSKQFVFGYSQGIIRFSPNKLNNSLYKPNIVLSGLQVFNKVVEVGSENSPLEKDINETKTLKLNHNQNFISIEYAALDHIDPENIIYACKLDGFDKEWNFVQKRRIVNYTNLPKGTYTFRVKSTNSEGAWVDNEKTLEIIVLPSFWETIWAYLIYLFFICGMIYLTVRILYTIYQLRGNIELEKKMSDMKMRFFTDISHEIRTPLTMVTAPVDYLINDSKTPDDVKKHLKTISQNTNKILRLVNQILDFRKIELTHIHVQQLEIAHFVEETCDTFSEIADHQHIKFKLINKVGAEMIWADPDCLDKIISNLLSNAFKYTPPGKSITVILNGDEKTISVSVIDTGRGMSKDQQKNLFVRFNSYNEDKSKPSTGIGLSMVKELVDKHSARVVVDSELGIGSTFTVYFQKGTSHFNDQVEINSTPTPSSKSNMNDLTEEKRLKDTPEEENGVTRSNRYSVLVVEDDAELRQFIVDIIKDEYDVIEAEDGVDGFEKAIKFVPDFIVSDIMMPRMDGVELLQNLKSDLITSHIPVVLLTAKTTIENQVEGLSYGADDYITKPFSVPYFKARIANLIQQREALQRLFRNKISNSQEPIQNKPAVYTHDEQFINKLIGIIESNIEDFDFTIEELGMQMTMSRSVFFKKVKSLTGLAPVEFVRDVKMKRASELLLTGQYMVKETAYMVGISDTKYFTRCFKVKFGMTPLEYKNAKSVSGQ